MIAEGFFPTLIYAEDVQLDTQQLTNDIIAWSKQDEGVKKTNVKGWHSQTRLEDKVAQCSPWSLHRNTMTKNRLCAI